MVLQINELLGTNAWTAYMGDLRRGWLGTQPVSDVLVMLDMIEDYGFWWCKDFTLAGIPAPIAGD
ncbi:MAG: hypothetical protein HC805_05585 [Alkalinema sp. RL_2_19]|nr:hypothetical protein [Alkalinema sp. RL_2_19]